MMRFRFLLIACLCLGLGLYGHEMGYCQAANRISGQLSSNAITCMGDTGDGAIWVGTENGLNRYNGTFYAQYLAGEGSISSNGIRCLYPDGNGNLWIGTDYGLDYYDGETGSFQKYNDGTVYLINGIEGYDSTHILYSRIGGLVLYDILSHSATRILDDKDVEMSTKMITMPNSTVWVLSKNADRILIYNRTFSRVGEIRPPGGSTVNDFTVSSTGIVYLATTKGVYCYDQSSMSKAEGYAIESRTSGKNTLNIARGLSNTIVAYVEGEGLYSVRPFGSSIEVRRIPSGSEAWAFCMYSDRQGNIWFSDGETGLQRFLASQKTKEYPISLDFTESTLKQGRCSANMVFLKDSRKVFLFNSIDGTVEEVPIPPLPQNVYLTNVVFDSVGSMHLILSDGSLLSCEMENRRIISTSRMEGINPLYVKCNADGSKAILCTDRIITISNGDSSSRPLDKAITSYLVSGEQGRIFICSEQQGILEWTEDGIIPFAEDIKNATSILTDSKGRTWVGTFNSGVFCIGEDTRLFTISNGLPENAVRGVLEDAFGRIWVSTTHSLSYYQEDAQFFSVYLEKSGGSQKQFSVGCCTRTADGSLIFGGRDGLTVVYPQNFEDGYQDNRLKIDALVVNNRTVIPEGSPIKLKYNENQLTFYFSQDNPSIGNLLNYSYRLKGADKDWRYISIIPRVQYNSLPAGRYSFQVRVQDPNGRWSDQILEQRIIIKPVFYSSVPMKILYGVMFLLTISVLIHLYTQRRISKRELEFSKRENLLNKQLNEAKFNFFTNFAHEILTPLSLIYAPVKELSKSPSLSGRDSALVDMIERSAEHMHRLTAQILKFDRLDQVGEELKVLRTDVSGQVASMVEIFSLSAAEKGITLETDIPEPMEVWCDIEKVTRILSNLLSNALKYTPEGGRIFLRVNRDGDRLKVEVSDTGVGIPEEKVAKIFEKYQRLDKESSKTEGYGVGLYYSLYLASLHKGAITVVPNQPVGTQFVLSIPCTKDSYTEAERLGETDLLEPIVQDDTRTEAVGSAKQRQGSILLVDDNRDILSYLALLFKDEFVVKCCPNGLEAWKSLEEEEPDIVVSDVMMPEMDGIELTRRIKESDGYCHIPVILLSAREELSDRTAGLENGADSYVAKPFDPTYLKTRVFNLLANRERIRRVLLNSTSEQFSKAQAVDKVLDGKDEAFVRRFYALLEEHLEDEQYSVQDISQALGMSKSSLHSKIRALTGDSPQSFFTTYRLNKAYELLKTTDLNVSEVAYSVGFNTLAGFSRSFKNQFGFSPSHISKGNPLDLEI